MAEPGNLIVPTSYFSLERTISDTLVRDLAHDLIAIDPHPEIPEQRIQKASPKKVRHAVSRWMVGKTFDEIEVFRDRIAEDIANRINPVADLVMGYEINALEHEIALISAYPQPIVEAYANGFEEYFDAEVFKVIHATKVLTDGGGRYTEEVTPLDEDRKTKLLKDDVKAGRSLEIVADSFSIDVARMGRHPVVFNPGKAFSDLDPKYREVDVIYTNQRDPLRFDMYKKGSTSGAKYSLFSDEGSDAFIEDFYHGFEPAVQTSE